MSTHYTAGSMPLAFTQEDFLVEQKRDFVILFTSTEFICQHDLIIIPLTWLKLLTEAASGDLDKLRLTHLSASRLSLCWQLIID